jgi:prophage DNA circulation protein
MKTYIWADTAYVSQDFFVVNADNIIMARLILAREIEQLEKAFMDQAAREDQASYRALMRTKFKGWIMYINQQDPQIIEEGNAGIFNHSN